MSSKQKNWGRGSTSTVLSHLNHPLTVQFGKVILVVKHPYMWSWLCQHSLHPHLFTHHASKSQNPCSQVGLQDSPMHHWCTVLLNPYPQTLISHFILCFAFFDRLHTNLANFNNTYATHRHMTYRVSSGLLCNKQCWHVLLCGCSKNWWVRILSFSGAAQPDAIYCSAYISPRTLTCSRFVRNMWKCVLFQS